jgi:PadR family transcriptional regulator PadR
METQKIIKGSLSTILLQLLQNNGRMYGYEIVKAVALASKEKINITEAALYTTLHKLQAEDCLTVSQKMVEGRVRKYYSLNKKGKKEAVLQSQQLLEQIQAVQKILKYVAVK